MTANQDPNDLQALKASVDLVALFESHGVAVRKVGRSLKALCMFHSETTPSMSVDAKKGVYHCFGCGESGDHITFLQRHLKRSFPEAVAELRQLAGQPAPAAEVQPEPEAPFPYDLMARVAEVWHQAFCERPEGLAYLESRGLTDKGILRTLQVGYCDGDKLLAITSATERSLLQQVGVLNEGGKEFFSRSVVFPLKDKSSRVVGFYGRSTLPKAKVPHRFCAGAKTGLFYVEAARGASSVFLVEGVLDSLALMQAGFSNVMALGGTQGLNAPLLDHLHTEKVQELVLCLDGDQAGQQAAQQLEERLSQEGFTVRSVSLAEGKDPLSSSAAELQAILSPKPQPQLEKRRYKKLSGAQGKLKVLVSLVNDQGESGEATIDLYSTRSRKQEAAGLARTLGLEVADIEAWLFQVLNELESYKAGEDEAKELFGQVDVPPMTVQQRRVALEFLRRPDLVPTILADMEALGYMGEEEAKLLGYAISVSRKLEKPLSAIIQSGSGAGKSYLAEIVFAMTPPEDVVFYSRISPQVLYHMPKEYLMHKLVGLEERVGGESSDYPIRALQSSGVLKQCITIKDPVTGQLLPKESEVWGPIAYMETTTSQHLNPENTSRCFEIPLDESPEQTARIHQRQKDLKGFERLSAGETRQGISQRHHDAQRLLEPVPVIIPFVHLLTFPTLWLRARRDHDRFLHLIEVLAYLHQFQRPRKIHEGQEYINATAADYRWAYFLANRVLSQSMDELSRWARQLALFFEEARPPEGLTRREIRQTLQWPDRRTREALEELVELEYLEVVRGANNRYTFHLSGLAGGSHSCVSLLHPDELESIWNDPT
jgi:DNA primase catalytic core